MAKLAYKKPAVRKVRCGFWVESGKKILCDECFAKWKGHGDSLPAFSSEISASSKCFACKQPFMTTEEIEAVDESLTKKKEESLSKDTTKKVRKPRTVKAKVKSEAE